MRLRYRAAYLMYDKDHHAKREEFVKDFNTVEEALRYQYKHNIEGFDLMIEDVYDNRTNTKIKIWEHTTPKSADVAV